MNLSREKFANLLLLAAVFLLPWQTQWIVNEMMLNNGAWEYGKIGIYSVEVLLLITVFLRGRPRIIPSQLPVVKASLVFLATVFFSVAFSILPQLSTWQTLHVVMAVILFFLLLDTRTNFKHIFYSFLAGLILPALLGWFQVITGTSPPSTLFGLSLKDAQEPGISVIETVHGRRLRAYGTFPQFRRLELV